MDDGFFCREVAMKGYGLVVRDQVSEIGGD